MRRWRRRLWLAGTTVLTAVVASTVALTVASSASTANLRPQSKAKPPPHWFVNSPVNLTFHVLHKRNENGIARLRESGNIGGERFDVVVAFNNDDTGPQSYAGTWDTKKINVTVAMTGDNGGDHTFKGSVGTAKMDFTISAGPKHVNSYPIAGSIDGQRLKARWTGDLAGTLGKARFSFSYKPGNSQLVFRGRASQGRFTGRTAVAFKPETLTGKVSGPTYLILCWMGLFPTLELNG